MEFDEAVAELDGLVQALEREGDARALRLLELVDAVHRPALVLIRAGESEHPTARALLAMYDLAPLSEYVQVAEALDEVRPQILSEGATLDLLGVEGGVVRVRFAGPREDPEAQTLIDRVEAVLRERCASFSELVVQRSERGRSLPIAGGRGPEHPLPVADPSRAERPLPVADPPAKGEPASNGRAKILRLEGLSPPVFAAVGTLSDFHPGELRATDAAGTAVLLTRPGEDVHAFRNACAIDGLPLEGGRLAGTVLICPWHNCAYDARSGKRVDGDGPSLQVVPVRVREGAMEVAVGVA